MICGKIETDWSQHPGTKACSVITREWMWTIIVADGHNEGARHHQSACTSTRKVDMASVILQKWQPSPLTHQLDYLNQAVLRFLLNAVPLNQGGKHFTSLYAWEGFLRYSANLYVSFLNIFFFLAFGWFNHLYSVKPNQKAHEATG